jgi:hypothetical protein
VSGLSSRPDLSGPAITRLTRYIHYINTVRAQRVVSRQRKRYNASEMKVLEAKNFLVDRIKQQAQLEGTPLSDLEVRMLYFTENEEPTEDPIALNAEFEEQYDTNQFEQKISKLMRRAYKAACAEGDSTKKQWNASMRRLSQGDHYLPVMWDVRPPVGISKGKALIWGVSLAAMLLGGRWFLLHATPPSPRLLLVFVLGFALAGYLLRSSMIRVSGRFVDWLFSVRDSGT